MNSSEMIDMVDNLYKAKNLARALCVVADGLRDQPDLAGAIGEMAGQIEQVVTEVRDEMEVEIKRLADERAAA